MITKLMSLTNEQRDAMASHAQKWIERGLRTTPLSDEEWTIVEDKDILAIVG